MGGVPPSATKGVRLWFTQFGNVSAAVAER